MIDVLPRHLAIIKNILGKNIPDVEVRAFGSRVAGTAKEYSDLDLALIGDRKLPAKTVYALKEDFQESDLPFRVDVIDWNSISGSFRDIIEKQYEVIRKPAQNS